MLWFLQGIKLNYSLAWKKAEILILILYQEPYLVSRRAPSVPPPVNKWHRDELVCTTGPAQRGEQVLHCFWTRLAVHGLHLPRDGVRGCGPACVGRWQQGLRVQHRPTGLQQRVLRQHLPHLTHPPVGPAANFRHLPISDGGGARQVSGKERLPIQQLAPRETSVCQSWKEAWRAVVDLPGKNRILLYILLFINLLSVLFGKISQINGFSLCQKGP